MSEPHSENCCFCGLGRSLKTVVVSGMPFFLAAFLFILILNQQYHSQGIPNDWPQTAARLQTLLSGDADQKRSALFEIRSLRSPNASRLAVPALKDADEIVRAAAAAAIVFGDGEEAKDMLLPLLNDKRPFVRREAAFALGMIRHSGASAALRRSLLVDRDKEVRASAAMALGEIADASALEDLLSLLAKRPREDEEFIRRAAARAVGQIFEMHHTGRSAAVTPQNFLPPKSKDTAAFRKAPPLSSDVSRTLAVLSDIVRNSGDADDTRREAAFALGALRQPPAEPVLRGCFNSKDPYLAEICREGLLKLQDLEQRVHPTGILPAGFFSEFFAFGP